MKKEKNDFPLRTAAKEIKISFVLTAVVDLILGVILLFAPEHVTDVLVMLISAGITIYGVFNILSFIFSRGMTAYSFGAADWHLRNGVRRFLVHQSELSAERAVHRIRSDDYRQQHQRH